MDDYFQFIVKSLTRQEVDVLNVLLENSATIRVKAMKNSIVHGKSNLSEAIFRKVIDRLRAMRFIEVDESTKEHSFFINGFGKDAVKMALDSTPLKKDVINHSNHSKGVQQHENKIKDHYWNNADRSNSHS
ncbi:hypothetical protein ACFQZT_12690 [Paenibacillus sp. GCM10027628]|uniref:hypothetical protein n=1 Tax=Paenibacillus sp. GCM10027628 TaxID=3273413 RepID=UPI0036446710